MTAFRRTVSIVGRRQKAGLHGGLAAFADRQCANRTSPHTSRPRLTVTILTPRCALSSQATTAANSVRRPSKINHPLFTDFDPLRHQNRNASAPAELPFPAP